MMDSACCNRHDAWMKDGQVSVWGATILGLVTAAIFYRAGRWIERIVGARAAHKRAKESVPLLRRLFWATVRAGILTLVLGALMVFVMGTFAVQNGSPSSSPSPSPSPTR